MKKSMSILLVTAISALAAATAPATKTFRHKKAKFTLQYPSDWTLSVDQDGIPAVVTAPDGKTNVQVFTETLKANIAACDFLTQREVAAPGGRTNLIPEESRKTMPGQLQFMAVKDGCIGAYKTLEGEAEIFQGVGVYISGKTVWTVIQNLPATAREAYGPAIGEIAKSFKAK